MPFLSPAPSMRLFVTRNIVKTPVSSPICALILVKAFSSSSKLSKTPRDSATMSHSPVTELSKPPSQVAPLPLPEPPTSNDGHVKLDMSHGSAEAKLDSLGPLVVNQDGTVSRINNWGTMSEIERENTLRILGKRNKLRLNKLKGETPQP